jgi:hypothetical protein
LTGGRRIGRPIVHVAFACANALVSVYLAAVAVDFWALARGRLSAWSILQPRMLRALGDGAASGVAGDPRIFAASVFFSAAALTPFLLRFLRRRVADPDGDVVENALMGGFSGVVFGLGVAVSTAVLVPLLSASAPPGVLGSVAAAISLAVFGGLVAGAVSIPVILFGGCLFGALEATFVRQLMFRRDVRRPGELR